MVALARGLDVLKSIGEHPGTLGNAEIARLTSLSKATVSRLTYTLSSLGYIEYVDQLGRYRVAAGAVSLGYAALAGRVLTHIARPYMKALADRTGLAVAVGVRSDNSMVYLVNERSENLVTLRLHPGSTIPMATTAMGHGYLASLGAEERQVLLETLKVQNPAEWDTRIAPAIQQNMELYAQSGMCVVTGLWHRYVNAVSVPFVPEDGSGTVVFSLGGIADYAPESKISLELGQQLLETVRLIKATMAGTRRSLPIQDSGLRDPP